MAPPSVEPTILDPFVDSELIDTDMIPLRQRDVRQLPLAI